MIVAGEAAPGHDGHRCPGFCRGRLERTSARHQCGVGKLDRRAEQVSEGNTGQLEPGALGLHRGGVGSDGGNVHVRQLVWLGGIDPPNPVPSMTRAGWPGQSGLPVGVSADRQPAPNLELGTLSEIHHGPGLDREGRLFLNNRFAGEKPRPTGGGQHRVCRDVRVDRLVCSGLVPDRELEVIQFGVARIEGSHGEVIQPGLQRDGISRPPGLPSRPGCRDPIHRDRAGGQGVRPALQGDEGGFRDEMPLLDRQVGRERQCVWDFRQDELAPGGDKTVQPLDLRFIRPASHHLFDKGRELVP